VSRRGSGLGPHPPRLGQARSWSTSSPQALDQLTRTLPLDEGAAAFDQSTHGRTGGSKIVLLVTSFAAR
jgi:hypothetical protein